MRTVLTVVVLVLLGARGLAARGLEPEPEARRVVEPKITEVARERGEPNVAPLRAERVAARDEANPAQWPPRGSFWWYVGVIVVAGVILAVLL